jgi:hypothetical protein
MEELLEHHARDARPGQLAQPSYFVQCARTRGGFGATPCPRPPGPATRPAARLARAALGDPRPRASRSAARTELGFGSAPERIRTSDLRFRRRGSARLALAFAMAGSSSAIVDRRAGSSRAARTSPHDRRGGTGPFYTAGRTERHSIWSRERGPRAWPASGARRRQRSGAWWWARRCRSRRSGRGGGPRRARCRARRGRATVAGRRRRGRGG